MITRRDFLDNVYYITTVISSLGLVISCTKKEKQPETNNLLNPQFYDITIDGDLLQRAQRNFDRLHDPLFQYKNIAKHTLEDPYPGDFIGRTILGLVQLAQVLNQEPQFLAEIVEKFPKELVNDKGYTGKILENGFYDEIQITGHQFFLRGLCELYLWQKDDTIRDIIQSTVQNMMIPLANDIKSYPLENKRKSLKKGGTIAMDAGLVENWQLSTDTCQLFMVLDGLTQVYQIFPSNELKTAIEQIFNFYCQIDLLQIKAQTHSTLSALRGILRFYELLNKKKYLNFVERIYADYKKYAMTENYENYNWFGRPAHTEGCAVIDSFLLAVELWKATGQQNYLHDAHLIYYNGVRHNQWTNGGFGANNCLGTKENARLTHKVEATWCCTMRGSEGLAKAGQYGYFYDQDNIYIPFYHNSTAVLKFKDGDLHLGLKSSYPEKGDVRISVIKSTLAKTKTVYLFIPEWIDRHSIKVNSRVGQLDYKQKNGFLSFLLGPNISDPISITFDILFYTKPPHQENIQTRYTKYFHGPVLLGCNSNQIINFSPHIKFEATNDPGKYRTSSGVTIKPLNTLEFENIEAQKKSSFQFLFKNI